MSDDKKHDYVRPMDEAAKQIYRNDPGFALKVEGMSYLAVGALFLFCLVVAMVLKAFE